VSGYREVNRRAHVSAVCRALASRSRIQILNCLRRGPKSVDQITSAMPMISRPAISQHLRILLEANLVTYEAQGRRSLFQLNLRGLENLRQYMDSLGLKNLRSSKSSWKRN